MDTATLVKVLVQIKISLSYLSITLSVKWGVQIGEFWGAIKVA